MIFPLYVHLSAFYNYLIEAFIKDRDMWGWNGERGTWPQFEPGGWNALRPGATPSFTFWLMVKTAEQRNTGGLILNNPWRHRNKNQQSGKGDKVSQLDRGTKLHLVGLVRGDQGLLEAQSKQCFVCALHHPIQLHVKIGLSPAVRVGVLLVCVSFENKVTE